MSERHSQRLVSRRVVVDALHEHPMSAWHARARVIVPRRRPVKLVAGVAAREVFAWGLCCRTGCIELLQCLFLVVKGLVLFRARGRATTAAAASEGDLERMTLNCSLR